MIYRSTNLEIDTDLFCLRRAGEQVDVEPQVFDLLVYLVEHRDRVVSREELLDSLWKGKVVTDSALNARLKAARRAAGDTGRTQGVIKTIHGRGYRFVADVVEAGGNGRPAPASVGPDGYLAPERPSVAVLPFENLSSDPEQGYFSDGITEDIISALSKIGGLVVVSRHSTFIYKDRTVDVRDVGREQGVRYVLEGSVRKAGGRVRVTAQLIDARSGHHVWAERYDRELVDIFTVQDEITREVVVWLDVHLGAGEQARLWSSGTRNLEAWQCMRRSMDLLNSGDSENLEESRRLCERALELDPGYPMAWVNLGWFHHHRVDVGIRRETPEGRQAALELALECAGKALELNPSFADACCLKSFCHLSMAEYDQALAMAERAISLAPRNAEILALSAVVGNKSGQPRRSAELVKKAMRFCPVYPGWYLLTLGSSYRMTGQTEKAVPAMQEAARRSPDFLAIHVSLASVLGELGRVDEADRPVAEILRIDPEFSIARYVAGLCYRDPGELERFQSGLRAVGLPD